jgi:hypothetical protein
MIWAVALILIGMLSLSLGTVELRDFRQRRGDFSDWIVSDATKLNRRLWVANARLKMAILLLLGPVLAVGGLYLLSKQ